MLNYLRKILGPSDVATRTRIQKLELELRERDEALNAVKADLERERASESERLDERVRERLNKLMDDLSGPLQQLLTQNFLVEKQGNALEAKDVLAVARRLVRTFEQHGLSIEVEPGATVDFDPNTHETIGQPATLEPGQSAVVKLPSLAFNGRLLRKAGVAPAA